MYRKTCSMEIHHFDFKFLLCQQAWMDSTYWTTICDALSFPSFMVTYPFLDILQFDFCCSNTSEIWLCEDETKHWALCHWFCEMPPLFLLSFTLKIIPLIIIINKSPISPTLYCVLKTAFVINCFEQDLLRSIKVSTILLEGIFDLMISLFAHLIQNTWVIWGAHYQHYIFCYAIFAIIT